MTELLSRISEYRVMWIFVSFDLPTYTDKERKRATKFRKELLKDGFTMFQFSLYIRCCPSKENLYVHIERIKKIIPKDGKVAIFQMTDKQFGMIQIFDDGRDDHVPPIFQQLGIY